MLQYNAPQYHITQHVNVLAAGAPEAERARRATSGYGAPLLLGSPNK
ncbi:hypothetical protein [Paenibacillus segetis]|nr:hypothetical protein [Paenibacillus segetis]